MLFYIFWALISTNPIATAIATEYILVDQHTALYFSLPLNNGATVSLVSPWIPYVLYCLGLGALMVVASIVAVRRAER